MQIIPIKGDKQRRFLKIDDNGNQTVISRRQGDILSGRLKFRSYEAKAKANKQANPIAASLRPARGRQATKIVSEQTLTKSKLRALATQKPLKHSAARQVIIPTDVVVGTIDEMLAQAAMTGLTDALAQIQAAASKNPRVISFYVNWKAVKPGGDTVGITVPGPKRESGSPYEVSDLIKSVHEYMQLPAGDSLFLPAGTHMLALQLTIGYDNSGNLVKYKKGALKIKPPKQNKQKKVETTADKLKRVEAELAAYKEREKDKKKKQTKRKKSRKMRK
jgi:hypothetical protein